MKRAMAESSRGGLRLVLLLFLAAPLGAQPVEQESSGFRPQPNPDPFYQPVDDQTWTTLPPALSTDGTPVPTSFFEPEELDMLDSLPQALDEHGQPVGDVDERLFAAKFPKPPPPEPKESWLKRNGFIEYSGTYSTNIDLSAPDIDTDLRRRDVPVLEAIRDTEVSDYISGLRFGYQHEMDIVPEVSKLALRYRMKHFDYNDEDRESSTTYNPEAAIIHRLGENTEWEIYGGWETDNRNNRAQYLRPDYDGWYVGTEARHQPGEGKYLVMGYEFTHRDYNKLVGVLIPNDSPYFDWSEHKAWLDYDHDLCQGLTLNVGLTARTRQFEQPALFADGREMVGTYREYDLWEPRIGLTFTPTANDTLGIYYEYRNLAGRGDYYDYQEDAFIIEYTHLILPHCFPGLVFRSQFEYSNRDYDDQIPSADNPLTGLRTPLNDVREDERVVLYMALERDFGNQWLAGLDYSYIDNDSNDDSSRYQEDRYGFYVRRSF